EALECKMGFVGFNAISLHNITYCLLRFTQIADVEIALAVEYLSMLQHNFLPGFALYLEAHPADHVLPHIDDKFAFRRLHKFQRLKLINDAYRVALLSNENVFRVS